MIPNVQVKPITVKANQTTTVDVSGSKVIFVSSSGAFQFSLDGGPLQTGLCILAVDVTVDIPQLGGVVRPPLLSPQFKSIILKDLSGSDNTITMVITNAAVSYLNPNPTTFVKNAPTYCKGTGDKTLNAGLTDTYNGLDGSAVRKQFIVTNLETVAGTTLLIQDPAGNNGVTVYPQQSKTFESGGTIKINNPNGTPIHYEVMETFQS